MFAAALAVSVAAGSGGVALASGAAGHGAVWSPARAAVPWHRVGTGWVLAEYGPGRFAANGKAKAAAVTLYLISPGVKYRLFRWASTKTPPVLLD